MLGYFLVLNLIYTMLLVLGWRAIRSYVHRRRLIDYDEIARSPATIPISIIVPAFNEGPVIVDAVRSLLGAHYPTIEVVVVNDGSSDATVDVLIDAFSLVEVTLVPRANLATAEIRRTFVSAGDSRLVVLDKENGGKTDALNTAIRFARYPLVCTVDADSLLDPRRCCDSWPVPDRPGDGRIRRHHPRRQRLHRRHSRVVECGCHGA